ncbi:sugar kinase [Candidatus Synechococcus spongiarum LMB bulk10E]|nr:sugar kinase [Candidatus Synechococcus spongiarum LMB bulk10E]OOV36069.1 sugar kinase [Candidatus Synechococcus spongiarum LMB bulk10D]
MSGGATRLALGVDLGSSGLRVALMDPAGGLHHQAGCAYPGPFVQPRTWQQGLTQLCGAIPLPLRRRVAGLAVAGTSGTLLAVDTNGHPLGEALPYNAAQPQWASRCRQLAEPGHPAASASGTTARALELQQRYPHAHGLRHQAEWLTGWLLDQWHWGDMHNSLKLGWDPVQGGWSGVIGSQPWFRLLPRVVRPGTALGPLHPTVAHQLGLPTAAQVVAGTTDSNAAVLAVDPQPGDGVTVLGTTMALKQLCPEPLQDAGVYSHPVGNQWLVGGASNSGGGVLRQFFDSATIAALSRQLDPRYPTGLHYLPLPAPGERFPVDDPRLMPRLEPRPVSDALFLQGLLEGIAAVEARGWARLQVLGAPPVRRVLTVGGGARNPVWRQLRQQALGCPVLNRPHASTACGAAQLARRGLAAVHCDATT